MGLYLSDEEQVNLIREWLKKHGKLLILSITIFLITFFLVHTWQEYKTKQIEKASLHYEKLLANIQEQKHVDYSKKQENTPYGQLIALLAAQAAIEQNDLDTAINHFNWIISHTKNSGLKQISRIRLARVLLAQNKPELALKQINTIDNEAFNPLINAVKANILMALNRKADAKQAYEIATKTINPTASIRPLMMMQLDQ